MTIYPEKDVALLQQPSETITNYDSSYFSVPNDQAQPEVDIALLPGVPGQRGPQGEQGPQGPAGPQGASGGFLTFTQNAVSTTWTITHALGYYPSVTTTDSAGTVIEGTISYPSITSVVVTFGIATSGFAYLS
jgi:hypothetical protein